MQVISFQLRLPISHLQVTLPEYQTLVFESRRGHHYGETFEQGHLPEHPKETYPGRSLNLRPLVPQDSTLTNSYCNSLCFCYSETLYTLYFQLFPIQIECNTKWGLLQIPTNKILECASCLNLFHFFFVLTIQYI